MEFEVEKKKISLANDFLKIFEDLYYEQFEYNIS